MKIEVLSGGFKTVVVFIHGFRGVVTDWDHSHPILDVLSRSYVVITVQLDDDDYKGSIPDVSESIYDSLSTHLKKRMIIVAHSQGVFYAQHLAINHREFIRLLLLDPTVNDAGYLAHLQQATEWSEGGTVERAKLDHHHTIPRHADIPPRVIVRIHADFTADKIDRILILGSIVKKNTESRLMIHTDVGHMIHWAVPEVIISSIRELPRL